MEQLKALIVRIDAYDEQLDAMVDDFSEGADDRYDAILALRDPLVEQAMKVLSSIGIDEITARSMMLTRENRQAIIKILDCHNE